MAYSGGSSKVAAGIRVLMLQVPGVANVFEYMPMARDWKSFLAKFQDDVAGNIAGWAIERKSTQNEWLTSDQNLWTHRMVIRGYYGVNEAHETGKAFTALVDDVVNKFDDDKDLLGMVEEHQPAQVRVQDHRVFGGVLVHYCEIEISCQERITRLPGGSS